ncbi:MAG: C69 family dipeptidase [Succiniclasticum sp.]
MPCTTILVGKHASYDGSTLMARNEDSPSGKFTAKKFVVVNPEDQPRQYHSVLSKFSLALAEAPLRYTAMPNAEADEGIWGEAGINEANVAMSETETITSNARVLGADPLVPDGIGEEDMLTLVLPYIRSAREGVLRLGDLLGRYGTYEMNGIGFQDRDEIWWMETIGGHHWMARRVPDDGYVVMPNQQGIDTLNLADALGAGKDTLCSADLADFIRDHFLDLTMDEDKGGPLEAAVAFDARAAFGSHDDADHTYNTPRAWFILRYLNPTTFRWDGPEADFRPEDDNLPWTLVPERKITVEDVKYVLSGHYQGTPFDCYGRGPADLRGKYRPIGINRNNFVAVTQLRPYGDPERCAVEWIAEGCNVFNALVPFYANVTKTPAYLAETGKIPDTNQFYWANRLIGALSDAHFALCANPIERYQNAVGARARAMLEQFDKTPCEGAVTDFLAQCNEAFAAMAKEETDACLGNVLYQASSAMKNSFARSDS